MTQFILQLFPKKTILLISLLFFYIPNSFADMNLNSGHGIRIYQINYLSESPQTNSNTGLLDIDLIALRSATNMEQGYINMLVGDSWKVRNLKIKKESEYPYSHITTPFNLGVEMGTDVSELNASISISAIPLKEFSSISLASYTVESIDYMIGGVPDHPVVAPPSPPTLEDILFGNPTNTDAITQFDHPNIEAAVNQCMPASIANSLQYLEDTTDLEIPHEHKMGLKGDDSLVGQLDTHTDRTVVDRRSDVGNSGTWGLAGKMSYLATNGLQNRVVTTHMGNGDYAGTENVSVAVDGKTATATGLGTSINFTTLLNAMKEGQDCELVYAWPGGAHAVDAVAAGTTNGEPWIVHGSDIDQSSDSRGAGASGFVFEYLKDTDNDGLLNLSGTDSQLVQVICEKYVAPPATLTVTAIEDPAGHSCCVTPPPSTVDIALKNGDLTISGNASWLPMTGTLSANGEFLLTSVATVAGFPNIHNSFSGIYHNGDITHAKITLGTDGGLPQQTPISYDVNIANTGLATTINPVIRANGFRREFSIDAGDPLSISITFGADSLVEQTADWWAVLQTETGLKSYNLTTGQFQDGLNVSYQGPLVHLPFTRLTLFNNGLEAGIYTFYFGVDLVQNGNLDIESASYDKVTVTVQ
ncbi:MAG: hypothetical protein AABY99_01045 [Pseudomonadota bacterium]